METVHLLIRGKVQGVNFRNSARRVAEKLKISGWIKNTDSGEVEATITGGEKAVEEFIHWCKTGPENAAVSEVDISKQAESYFDGFKIIRGK